MSRSFLGFLWNVAIHDAQHPLQSGLPGLVAPPEHGDNALAPSDYEMDPGWLLSHSVPGGSHFHWGVAADVAKPKGKLLVNGKLMLHVFARWS